jgi:hypothetical protein
MRDLPKTKGNVDLGRYGLENSEMIKRRPDQKTVPYVERT